MKRFPERPIWSILALTLIAAAAGLSLPSASSGQAAQTPASSAPSSTAAAGRARRPPADGRRPPGRRQAGTWRNGRVRQGRADQCRRRLDEEAVRPAEDTGGAAEDVHPSARLSPRAGARRSGHQGSDGHHVRRQRPDVRAREPRLHGRTRKPNGELDPVGRISLWTDTNNDGVYDKHTIFVDTWCSRGSSRRTGPTRS